jgi:surface antigen
MHAAVLVIALTVSGYASATSDLNPASRLRLGIINAEGQTTQQGGTVGDVSLGRLSTIIKPIEVPAGPPVSHAAQTYTVGAGDTVASIADRFGVTEDDIRASNPPLFRGAGVTAGQEITVPPIHGFVYTVADGDTVGSLASRFQVEGGSISDFNFLPSGALVPGIQLVIPGGLNPDLYPRRATNQAPHLGSYANGKFAYGYCTWYVASRRPVPWTGDAWQWFGGAKAMGFPTGQTPQPGAIMVTWESWVGHVAYVEQVNADGSYVVSEMNYAGWGRIDTRTIRPGQVPLIGFIYGQ